MRNLEVRSQGVVNSANEHIVLSKVRIRIDGPQKVRTDITYFAGESESSPKTREVVNIYRDGTFYFINKTRRTIDIFDKPQFEGSSGAPLLHAGKIAGYLGIMSDIARAVEPNLTKSGEHPIRKEFRYKEPVTMDSRLVEHLEHVNLDSGRTEYELFLDPNNWGMCQKIIWCDSNTGYPSKTHEFKNWSAFTEIEEVYPHTIIFTYFDKDGTEQEREMLAISNIAANCHIDEEVLQIDVVDFKDYSVTDYRVVPSLQTINVVD